MHNDAQAPASQQLPYPTHPIVHQYKVVRAAPDSTASCWSFALQSVCTSASRARPLRPHRFHLALCVHTNIGLPRVRNKVNAPGVVRGRFGIGGITCAADRPCVWVALCGASRIVRPFEEENEDCSPDGLESGPRGHMLPHGQPERRVLRPHAEVHLQMVTQHF